MKCGIMDGTEKENSVKNKGYLNEPWTLFTNKLSSTAHCLWQMYHASVRYVE